MIFRTCRFHALHAYHPSLSNRASNSMAIIRRHTSPIDRKLIFVSFPSSILSEILRRSNPSLPYRASQFLTQDEGSKLEERIRTSFLLPSFSPLSFSPFLYFLYNPDGFIEKPPTLSAVRETGYKLRAKTQYGRSTFGVIHF